MEPNRIPFDRRQVYRPFLERLNPGSLSVLDAQNLIVPPEHDPRDPDQPPIHVAFANTAELNRGSQMALVGGIGSGKTTELRLTYKLLKRHTDAINIFVDLAELTDLNELNPGAILIALGLQAYTRLQKAYKERDDIKLAHNRLQLLAKGNTNWVERDELDLPDEDPDDRPELIPVHTPGLLKPRFPAVRRNVKDVRNLVIEVVTPLLESEAQITIIVDGLDRLIRPERFREFAEQDLRALRDIQVSIIVAAPLLLWFDKSRFLQDYFDDVKHIPTAISDPEKSDFLKQVLIRRGAGDLMGEREISEIARSSGGVLRDLITLARTSAETAYRDDRDRISAKHVRAAIRQLGKRYLLGLGKTQRKVLQRLIENDEFSTDNPTAGELLINRQVLEYFSDERDFFAAHPALIAVLMEST